MQEHPTSSTQVAEAPPGATGPGAARGPAGGGAPTGGRAGVAAAALASPEAPDARLELAPTVSMHVKFDFGEVRVHPRLPDLPTPPPDLGALAAFVGTWAGSGFNTIFRPNTLTPPGGDNVLELNLTRETLSFSPSLGSVPNRGMVQADAFLNGVPYVQAINDVTSGKPTGIHFEPGLWMSVPPTADPAEGPTLVRMASIPHGTTILAQGSSFAFSGPPAIPPVDITPFFAGQTDAPPSQVRFSSQDATPASPARIPEDLSSFITAGTITQAILDDPNTVLRNANQGLDILGGTRIEISTAPGSPLFGGGTENIAFLLGRATAPSDPDPPGQNAQTIRMTATFWISTVRHVILVPVFHPGQAPMILRGQGAPGCPGPLFRVHPPFPIPVPRPILVLSTQIQYSQEVILNFNGLSWPHVSVATLVPQEHLTLPPSAWE